MSHHFLAGLLDRAQGRAPVLERRPRALFEPRPAGGGARAFEFLDEGPAREHVDDSVHAVAPPVRPAAPAKSLGEVPARERVDSAHAVAPLLQPAAPASETALPSGMHPQSPGSVNAVAPPWQSVVPVHEAAERSVMRSQPVEAAPADAGQVAVRENPFLPADQPRPRMKRAQVWDDRGASPAVMPQTVATSTREHAGTPPPAPRQTHAAAVPPPVVEKTTLIEHSRAISPPPARPPREAHVAAALPPVVEQTTVIERSRVISSPPAHPPHEAHAAAVPPPVAERPRMIPPPPPARPGRIAVAESAVRLAKAQAPAAARRERAQAALPPAPVQITVGRIEVRAVASRTGNAETRRPAAPRLSLDEYLQQRHGGVR